MNRKLLAQLDEVRALPIITLEKLVQSLSGDALIVLCLISIMPFMQPIPIPGVSSVLGLIVILQGFGMMFSKEPILTHKMKSMVITHERFGLIYKAAEKFTSVSSKFSYYHHPMTRSKPSHFICGLAIVLSAAFLSLPLPIPFSNFIPALSIALICVGLLEEDVILILIGLCITLAVMWMATFSVHLIKEQLQNYF